MLPFVSLDMATAPTVGVAKDLETVLSNHRLVMKVDGNPTSFRILMEASLDGVNWHIIGDTNNPAAIGLFNNAEPTRFVRANLLTLSGGTSPTVTAKIGSC